MTPIDQHLLNSLTIQSVGHRGEGVAQWNNNAIFIPRTLPGELVEVRTEGERSVLSKIITSSPQRVQPFCVHFQSCGGCQLQHWEKAEYLSWKHDLVVKALRHVGIEVEVNPIIDAAGRGRRRATLHGRKDGTGFFQLRSSEVHDLDQCPILVPALAAAADITRACFAVVGDCDVTLIASDTGLDVAIASKREPKYQPLIKLATRFKLARLSCNGEAITMRNPPEIRIGKASVRLPSGSFLQATSAAEQVLADLVIAGCKGPKRVADLFSGVGPFALRLAEKSKTHIVDNDKAAISACTTAMRATPGLKMVGAETRDLVQDPLVASELKPFNAVVIDPPRAGAAAQVAELVLSKVPRVVSVSCNPTTFSRDAKILIDGGFTLESVTPVDQFIWSAHVEMVGVFVR